MGGGEEWEGGERVAVRLLTCQQISQLYKELKEGEENMLLLTKKYDMMKVG